MTLVTPTKSVNTSLLSWQDITTGNVTVGSAVSVLTKYAASFGIRIARRSGTAFTAGFPNIFIEVSEKSSGNDGWFPLIQIQPAVGASIANTTLNGALSAAATSFVVTANTNMAVGDMLFLGDSSQANYEIVRIKTISGTTITPWEAITFAHANSAIVTSQPEIYYPAADVTPYNRVRAVADNTNSGQSISVQVTMTTFDSHTIA
jgi:hypothetical protein